MKSESIAIIILAIAIVGLGTYSVLEIKALHQKNDLLKADLGQTKTQFTEFAQSKCPRDVSQPSAAVGSTALITEKRKPAAF